MAAEWYYTVMGETIGPLSAAELRRHARDGRITYDSYVRKGTDGKWVTADSVRGLWDKTRTENAAPQSAEVTREHSITPDQATHAPQAATRTSARLPSVVLPIRILAGIVVGLGVGVALLLLNSMRPDHETTDAADKPVVSSETGQAMQQGIELRTPTVPQQPLPPSTVSARQQPATVPAPAVDPDQKMILECVEGWLESQKRGDSGAYYFHSLDNVASLYAVRNWEILFDTRAGSHPITVFEFDGYPAALVKVRIDSSTRGGLPITKIWTLSMRRTAGKWKIEHFYGQDLLD